MASDNRDWYRDWWRKKTGYVERASFRVSEGERKRQRYRAEWRRNLIIFGLFLAFVIALIFLKRS